MRAAAGTDTENQRKFVCYDPSVIPVAAIVDADMMDGMPRDLLVATGMDSLTHAIEGYVTAAAWQLPDLLHLHAVEMIAGWLAAAAKGDPDALERMALAQYVAGMGFSNVGLGLVHAMAHPLGGFSDIAHGVANGVLLPTVMACKADAAGEKMRDIARAMGVPGVAEMTLAEAGAAAVKAVDNLARELGIPLTLRELGVREAALPALTEAALADVCAGGNPRVGTYDEVLALYSSLY